MTVYNRDNFLENVAANLGRPRQTSDIDRPNWSVSPQWHVYKNATQEELVTVLEEQCKKIYTAFKRTTVNELPTVLKETIQAYEGTSIIAADDARNKTYGLVDFFHNIASDGIEVHLWHPEKKLENQQFAARADIGITFSDITLAESGTVTLFNDKYNGRSLSLLPTYYIAIIPKSTVVPRLTQAMKQIHEKQNESVSSCVSFISGPSNSADIESHLIVGVHGPIKATYIVVE